MKRFLPMLVLSFLLGGGGLTSAQASTLNISSATGTYDVSPQGTFDGSKVYDLFSGSLAAYTSVTFNYAVTSAVTANNDKQTQTYNDSYSYVDNQGNTHWGATNAYAGTGGSSGSSWGQNGLGGTETLITSLATMSADGKTASITITNISNAIAQYTALYELGISSILSQSITYTVSSTLAQTPLPAALPLFGMGLAFLGAKAAKRKKA